METLQRPSVFSLNGLADCGTVEYEKTAANIIHALNTHVKQTKIG